MQFLYLYLLSTTTVIFAQEENDNDLIKEEKSSLLLQLSYSPMALVGNVAYDKSKLFYTEFGIELLKLFPSGFMLGGKIELFPRERWKKGEDEEKIVLEDTFQYSGMLILGAYSCYNTKTDSPGKQFWVGLGTSFYEDMQMIRIETGFKIFMTPSTAVHLGGAISPVITNSVDGDGNMTDLELNLFIGLTLEFEINSNSKEIT